MKIYSKKCFNGVGGEVYSMSKHIDLNKCQFEDNDIFYYDRHDSSLRMIELSDFVDKPHWDHLKNNTTTKILIDYSDDYINAPNVDKMIKVILSKGVDYNQYYFLVMDNNFKNLVLDRLKLHGISGVNVFHYNQLLKNVSLDYPKNKQVNTDKKFSLLSRNYHPWRLELILNILTKGLINDFTYSFNNFRPYSANTDVTIDEVIGDIHKMGFEFTPEVDQWVGGLPYDIGSKSNKWSYVTYDTILNSDLHVLVESHFDPYLGEIFKRDRDKYSITELSPGFPTEKTWKVMSCERPFIVASTPYFLKDLKKLGFKSFSPFIDESYDEIIDDKLRLGSVTDEIKRISDLPKDKYDELLLNCKSICEFNRGILEKHHSEVQILPQMSWYNRY